MINVAAYLPEMARRQPDALAVAVAGRGGFRRLSCAELDRACDRAAHALVGIGIKKGTRTVLMVKPSPEFFALTFALFKIGAVPVMVDPGMGISNLKQCLAEAEPEAFIGIPKAHVARLLFGWARRTLQTLVTVGPRLGWGGHGLEALVRRADERPFPMPESAEDQLAAILFTSGSTGVPKGAEYTHGNFAAQVRLLREVYGIEPGELDLSTFPLFALFGPALGMASIVPEMDASRPASADPRKLAEAIRAFGCTNLFASPALIDKLGRHCEAQGITFPTLRRAISAGAPASVPAIARFVRCLPPGVEVFTPYGATEALPVASIGSESILGETRAQTETGGGACVGLPVEGVEVRIIPITDEPIPTWSDELALPEGQIGEIVVKGPVVTRRYFNREASTALAKIHEPATGAIRHRMGDVGYLDDKGRLWMCGRKSHRVQTEHGTLYTEPCEAIFNRHPKVFRSALVGVLRAGKVVPVVCIELERDASVLGLRRLSDELLELARRHEHTLPIETVLYHRAFPVDVRHNAKIFREKLAVWAQRRLGR
jgi:olefin beta-lactone synthetase